MRELDKEETLQILQDLNKQITNMSESEKEQLKKDIDIFLDREETEESKEENELRKNFMQIIL